MKGTKIYPDNWLTEEYKYELINMGYSFKKSAAKKKKVRPGYWTKLKASMQVKLSIIISASKYEA